MAGSKEVCLKVYDMVAIMISLADVVTDILITYEYYVNGHKVFFILSIIIMSIAQLSYCIIFAVRCMHSRAGICEFLKCCCCALPISPIVSLILYLFDNSEDNCLVKCCKFTCFGSYFNFSDDDMFQFGTKDQSDFNQTIMRKLSAHIGFILEAFVEAFPQSLIQMIAIVYYNRADAIAILSILISMLSVTTKSFVFSKGIEIKQFIFTWLCICTDFFGIFFAISWAFWTDGNDGSFTVIGQIWFAKLLFASLPIAVFGSIGAYIRGVINLMKQAKGCGNKCFSFVMSVFGFTLFLGLSCLLSEIFTFTLIALFLYYYGSTRFQKFDKRQESMALNDLISHIYKGKSNHDRALRCFAINRTYYSGMMSVGTKDKYPIVQWTKDIEDSKDISPISFKTIRSNALGIKESEYARFKNHLLLIALRKTVKTEIAAQLLKLDNAKCLKRIISFYANTLQYVLFPLYLLSKLITILFPFICIAYLAVEWFYYDNMHMPLFQLIMLAIYLLLICVLLILACFVFKLLFYLWHIAPGEQYVNILRIKDISAIDMYYDKMMIFPLIERLANKKFGADIANIILDYYRAIDSNDAPIPEPSGQTYKFRHGQF